MLVLARCSLSLSLTLGALFLAGCSRTGLLDDNRTWAACIDGQAKLTRAYPTAIFVLDRSESMTANFTSPIYSTSRWDALRRALVDTLPSIDDNVQLGAMLMPASSATGSCYINEKLDLAPALNNVSHVLDLIQASGPGGATPTNYAIGSAAEALLAIKTASSARAIVLATDGGPDCNGTLDPDTCRCAEVLEYGRCADAFSCLDDKRTNQHIEEYRKRGVPTYVIGIESAGDTSFSDVLNAMAEAGGRPQPNSQKKYYGVSSQTELNSALTAITAQVGACVFLSSSVPDDDGSMVLKLDGRDLASDQWSWQDRQHGELKLDPTLCAQIGNASEPALSARVSCGSP